MMYLVLVGVFVSVFVTHGAISVM